MALESLDDNFPKVNDAVHAIRQIDLSFIVIAERLKIPMMSMPNILQPQLHPSIQEVVQSIVNTCFVANTKDLSFSFLFGATT